MDVSRLRLNDARSGCTLRLRVSAGSRRERIVGPHGDALKVAVGPPPERGRANRAVLGLLAGALGLPTGRLRIVSGESSVDKVVLVEGLNSVELARKLQALG